MTCAKQLASHQQTAVSLRVQILPNTSLDPVGAPLLLKRILETMSAFHTQSKLELRANHWRGAILYVVSNGAITRAFMYIPFG
jgi:hypothetical protein